MKQRKELEEANGKLREAVKVADDLDSGYVVRVTDTLRRVNDIASAIESACVGLDKAAESAADGFDVARVARGLVDLVKRVGLIESEMRTLMIRKEAKE